MNTNAITVLKMTMEGPVDIIELMNTMKIHPWQIYSHIRSLKEQNYVVFENRQIRLKNDWKARFLHDLSNNINIEKILFESNEDIISYLAEPVSINYIVEKSGHSRATVYRAIKDFKSLGIIKKVSKGYELIHDNNALHDFAKWLKFERMELEALR